MWSRWVVGRRVRWRRSRVCDCTVRALRGRLCRSSCHHLRMAVLLASFGTELQIIIIQNSKDQSIYETASFWYFLSKAKTENRLRLSNAHPPAQCASPPVSPSLNGGASAVRQPGDASMFYMGCRVQICSLRRAARPPAEAYLPTYYFALSRSHYFFPLLRSLLQPFPRARNGCFYSSQRPRPRGRQITTNSRRY